MVVVSYLLIGLSGTLATWATAPASTLLVLRFAVAALVLAAVFARKRRLSRLLARDLWPRLLLMGALDAAALLLCYVAIRETSVVFVAVGLALAGLVVILVVLRGQEHLESEPSV